MFDAYTVKKVLPRLFVAVILIQLSWFIFTGMIAITNSIAIGVESLIYAPFGGAKGLQLQDILASTSGGNGMFIGLTFFAAAGGLLAVLAVGGVLATAAIALLGVLIAFAMLLARQVIVVALLLIAPLALVAWILPGTEKYWKMWWESFFKLLLVFPMIMALIATGRVLALVVAGVDPNSSTIPAIDDIITFFLLIVCIFGPFYMIPKTFQLAGGVFQTLTGTINNKSRGVFDRLRNSRQKTQSKNWEATKANERFKGNNALSRKLGSTMQKGTMLNKVGVNPLAMRRRLNSAVTTAEGDEMNKAKENSAVQTAIANDDLLDAFASSEKGGGTVEGLRAHYQKLGMTSDELERNVAIIEHAQRAVGAENFRRVAAVANAGTGTGYGNGPADMIQAINEAAGGNAALKARMIAEARGNAQRAQRGDLYAPGFSEYMQSADEIERATDTAAAKDLANRQLGRKALDSKSAGELASGRTGAVKNLIPAINDRVDEAAGQLDVALRELQAAEASGEQPKIDAARVKYDAADDNHKRVLAHTAAFLDAAGSANPEIAQELGDKVFGRKTLTGRKTKIYHPTEKESVQVQNSEGQMVTIQRAKVIGERDETYGDMIGDLRGDAVFGRYRREYGRAQDAEAAAAGAKPPGAGGPEES